MAKTPGTSVFPAQLDDADSLIRAANNASTTLQTAATPTDTTLSVASTAAFPTTGALSIDNEIVFYTATTSTSFTGCIRGQDGGIASAHAAGAAVEMRVVAAHHNVLSSAIVAVETKQGSGSSMPTAGRVLQGTGTGTSAWNNQVYLGGSLDIGTAPNPNPGSLLNVSGAIATAIATKTGAYSLTISDSVILADATIGNLTLSLPSAVGIAGRQYSIKKVDASANAVTLAATSSQTIDGATTFALTARWNSITVVSNGSNWFII